MSIALNSPFGSAFVSSLAGAFAGALAAYVIARVAEVRKDRLNSLRASNNAAVLAITCANMAMSVKAQHIRPLVRKFAASQEQAEAARTSALLGEGPVSIHIEADLTSITPLVLPLDALKTFVYSMNLTDARAVGAVAQLEQSLAELNSAIAIRETLVAEFKASDISNEEQALYKLLGFVREDGSVDQLYASTLYAIGQYVDDIIFFSVFLTEKLTQHAAMLHKNLYRIRSKVPTPHTVDFSSARCQALIPEDIEYERWLRGMQDKIH